MCKRRQCNLREAARGDGEVVVDGVINLNKEKGMSSARAVAAIKRMLPRGTKVGHAGTLDPFATGVLLILVGRGTKSCERLMSERKGYLATIKLGATTPTLDPESEELVTPNVSQVSGDRIRGELEKMIGQVLQQPPVFSALKLAGRPAYKLARAGQEVKLEPRHVMIYSIEVLRISWPEVRVQIECGRGTYIRAIARDLGEALGVGGYLTELCRTHVGAYHLADSKTLEELRNAGPACGLSPVPL